MLDVFKKLFFILTRRERKLFYVLVALMGIVTFAEVFGISTILILLSALSKPEMIHQNEYLSGVYNYFEFSSDYAFQLFLSLSVFMVVLIGLAIKALGAFSIIRYSTMRAYTISRSLLEAYLHQPYIWFLERNSSDISKNVLNEVMRLVTSVLIPALKLLANIILAVAIILFLIYVDPVIAVASAVIIGGGYALVYISARGALTRFGEEMMEVNSLRFRLTQEATGGFKEVKLMGMEGKYVDRFSRPSRRLATISAIVQLIRELPRFALEALTFGVLLGAVLLLLVRNDGNLALAIPTLGTFAISVMRLLPAIQQIYNGLASIRNGKPVLDRIYDDLNDARSQKIERSNASPLKNQLPIKKLLEIRNAYFAYPKSETTSLNDMSLVIPAHSTVGIVGGTGAGKTTLVDAILGLLQLESGEILVDGTKIDRDNIQAWRNSLGYVPQSIYLTDNTIAENIAFGVEPDAIDLAAVERAAKTAALHEFVVKELPQGYQTVVGERGVRLSGGQRQRIGIARALYYDPDLLLLDEATSALDNLTERAVMDAVNNIGHDKLVIMVAHRLSTVKNCDIIFLMEGGRLAASGTFDELVKENETFREMALRK